MVSRYEALILTVPEITVDEVKTIESNVDRLVKEAKGSIISFEKWGKYRLCYPIRKNDYGNYFLVRFDMPTPAVKELKSLFAVKFHELVMRDMIIELDPTKPLTYQRPPSLEDAPARDVNTFLKENKMEGLVSSDLTRGEMDDFDTDEE